MPNESDGKPSQMVLSLERLRGTVPTSFNATYSLAELIYDLGVPGAHERYVARVSVSHHSFPFHSPPH